MEEWTRPVHSKSGRKKNFTDGEIDMLVSEVAARRSVLFGGLSSGVTNRRKNSEWHKVAAAVNGASAQPRTVAELKKKWSDMKVEVKRRVAIHNSSVRSSGGGGLGPSVLSPLDARVAEMLSDTPLSGVGPTSESDTEGMIEPVEAEDAEDPGPSRRDSAEEGSEAGDAAASGGSTATRSPASDVQPPGSPRVLTTAVLESQNEMIKVMRNICGELGKMNGILSDMSETLKGLVKK